MEKNYKKELLLKGNSVKRLLKEFQSYEKEVKKLQDKIDEFKTNGEDEYQLNKHNEYIEESKAARNLTKTKLRTWTDELTNLVNEIEDDNVKQLEEYKNANEFLNNARELFESIQD